MRFFSRLALIHIWIKSWVGFGDHKCIAEELGGAFLSLCLHWKNEFRGKLYFSPILNHISQQWWDADVQPRFVLHLFCVENHDINTDQLWYGVRLLAEKQATNFGDGESLILFMRDAIGEYHQQGKVICWWFLWLFVVVWFGAFWNILVFSGEVQAWVCVEGPTSRGGVWWKDSCGL